MDTSVLDLIKIIQTFEREKIQYWLCHGTLLGIVRENRLLPWDNDIDIAVFHDDISKHKIRNLLNELGFLEKYTALESQCLHFNGTNKMIDINFYKVNSEQAYMKWLAPNITRRQKLLFMILSAFSGIMPDGYKYKNMFIRKLLTLAFVFLYMLGKILPKKLKKLIETFGENTLNYKGYFYPLDMMKFKKFEFAGTKVSVPESYKEMLRLTYGDDWMTPNPEFIWHQDSPSLN